MQLSALDKFQTRAPAIAVLIAIALIAGPASLTLYLVINSGSIPNNDYWVLLAQVLESGEFSDSWLRRGCR